MLKSCLQAFAVLTFLSAMFFITVAVVEDDLDTVNNGTISCINGEFEKGKCACFLGWRGDDCSQDCGCNGHSSCHKGVGLCDECQNYTTGQFCDQCHLGTFGNAKSIAGCQPCKCNGHEDPAKGSCSSTTGQCFCANNTEGFNCERCKPGYYGDSRLGGVCYEECQSRSVITNITSGHFGVPSSFSSPISPPGTNSQRYCLLILTVHSFDAKKFPLLTLPPVKSNMSLDPIMLTINQDLKVNCPYNNIAIYDGLPSFIAGGYLRKSLGSFCGNDLSSDLVLVANSGYLTLYFERQDSSQGFNASYLKLDCPEMCSQSPFRRCLGGICKCAKDHAGPTCSKVICPNKCNESNKKGSCDLLNGRCSCMPGYSQPDCSQSIGTTGNRPIWTTLYDSETANLRPTLAEYLPRMGHSMVSINESLWMFGGYSTEKGDMNDIYAFNLPTSRWEEIDTLQNDKPMARHFHASATLEDIIYIHGGLNEEVGVLGDFWTFHTTIKKWVKLLATGDVPPLAGHTLTQISERYLLLIGGYSPSNGFLDKVMEYDSQTLHWRVLDTNGVQPIGIYGHTAVCQPRKEVIYVYGGMLYDIDHVTISSYLFIFKRSTLTWLKLSPDPIINSIPLPRYFHAAVSTDNYMIILGGRTGIRRLEPLFFFISVYVYKCGSWINFANEKNIPSIGIPPDPAMAPSFTKASNGNLYLFGGFNGKTLGRLVRMSLPKDICHIFSSSRSYCLRHFGCAFCALYEGGTNKTFCYSTGIPPASCFNPKGASEITSGSPCNHNYFDSKRCGQYKNCVDCVSSSRTRATKSCKWCSSCQQGRCLPQGVSCESVMGDCPKGTRAISSTKLCPLRTCLASDCEKCLHLDNHCVWTRQILRTSVTSQNLQVKPIFDWTCVQAQEGSNFAIEYTPPSACPLKCFQHKSCSDCLESSGGEGGSHECIWSSSLKECMSPSYVKLRCEGGLCARGLIFQGERLNCIEECKSFKQSAHCLSRPDCGWCSFNDSAQDGRGVCMVGGLLGPTIGVCQSPEIYPADQNISLPRDLNKFKSYRWHYLSPPRENECANGHHSCDTKYEDCVDLLEGFLCKCKAGYRLEGKKCKPICEKGCVHGTCVEPNVCQCRFGFVGTNCSIECQCNGHSNCAGVERLRDCLECQNNTQGPQCQKCKPLHVGNPVNGGKCVECRTYCHGHSEVCLSREFLSKHQGLDLTQITSVQDFSDMVSEGPSSDAICLNCQHNTKGERCDQCKTGFFWNGDSIMEGCRECNCNGHGNTCDPTTGTGCPCHNNTENDRQCLGKHTKKTLPPCWQLQCSKCKEYYLGTPVDGHQCYKQMFLDKEHCFDAENIDGCNIPSHGLQQGRTALFAVQPRYMNVDIRVIIDISEGAADFFLSFKDDTFIINSDKSTNHHQIWLDSSYNFPLNMDTWEDFSSAATNSSSSSSSRPTPNSSVNFLTSSNIDTLSAGTSSRGSLFVIKQHSSKALTTYLRLTDPNELFIVRHLQKRLVLTIPQQVHDLRSTRLYMILKGDAEITNGQLFFRQDQSRIDLFVFFSVFFSCFFLFLSFCVLIWKVKQIFDMRRARRLHAAEIRSMASRPFSSMFICLDPSDSVDSYEYALSSPIHLNSDSAKKSKSGKRMKDSKDSPKYSASPTKSDHYLLRPVAVEFTWNGSAAIVTVLIILPGNHTTPVRLSLASSLVMLRGSHQNLAHHQSPSTNNIIGFRNIMRRRHSQYALA